MMRMHTINKFIYRMVLASLLLLALVYFIVGTQTGLNITWNLAKRFIPGEVSVATLRGNLISHLSLTDFNYTDGDTRIKVKSFTFHWDALKLFVSEFAIHDINLNDVDVYLPATSQKTTDAETSSVNPEAILSWLSMVNVERASISGVTVYDNNKPAYQLNSLLITRQPDNSHQLTILTSLGKISGEYKLSYFPGVEWSATLAGESIDLGKLNSETSGVINFSLMGHGKWSMFSHVANINLQNLSGTFRHSPLKATANFKYDNGSMNIENANIKLADAHASVVGELQDAWDLQWNVSVPSLGKLAPGSRGSFFTEGKVTGTKNQPELQFTIKGNNIVVDDLSIKSLNGKVHTQFKEDVSDTGHIVINALRYGDIVVPTITIKSASWFDGSKLKNNATISLDAANTLTSDLVLPSFTSFTDLSQNIRGVIELNLTDLSRLKRVLSEGPQLKTLQGRLTGKVNVSGRLNKPVLDANAQLTNAGMYAAKLGLRLSNANLNLKYHTGHPVKLDGGLNVGQGRVNIDGHFNVDSPALSMSLNVRGSNLQVMDSKEYKVSVSPDINLSYRDNDLYIRGTVTVPYALIEPTDFSSTVTLSSDVVIVNKKSDSTIPTNLALNVDVKLGDDVHLKYHDLKTQLMGGVKISQLPGNPPTATGELRVREGTYKAYGRTLQVEQGRLIYTGNLLSNPGISLRASQKVDASGFAGGSQFDSQNLQPAYTGSSTVVVGVTVRGTLDKPVIGLFSNAGLSQGDILSYLVSGSSQSQSSAAGGLGLLSAAAGIAGGGSSNPVTGITDKLGVSVDSGSADYIDTSSGGQGQIKSASTVGVGKNLGRDLSLHYSVGLFQQIAVFSLRYRLSRRFIIQTETSTLENGGDILYSLESAH